MTGNRRLTSLDGLRGVAALVVLLHHSLLLIPAMVEPYRDPPADRIGDDVWWLAYSPLHVAWDGSIAVMIFFVLSGFVLALPLAQGRVPDWRSYYPARLLRLYLPVWAAVALAAVVILVTPHAAPEEVSDWVAGHPERLAAGGVLKDLLLVWQPGYTNSALWSLKWEVLFSLLLPLYVWVASRWRAALWIKLSIVGAVVAIGSLLGPPDRTYQMGPLFHMGTFAFGVLIAFDWARIGPAMTALPRRRAALMWAASILGLWSYWGLYAFGEPPMPHILGAAARILQVVSATLIVVLSTRPGLWTAVLESPPLHWLGTRSFSLYLVHEPLVAASGSVGAQLGVPTAIVIPVIILFSLVAAEVFFRAIEKPSHRASRAVGRAVKSRRAAPSPA